MDSRREEEEEEEGGREGVSISETETTAAV